MRRRSSNPAVTLFPFLAVLVCTMGALIFLLLITTRRIQKQALLPVAAISVQEDVPEPGVLTSVIARPDLELLTEDPEPEPISDLPLLPELSPISEDDNAWLKSQWEAKQSQRHQEYERQLALRNEKQARINTKWQSSVDSLESELRKLRQSKALHNRDVSQLTNQKTSIEQKLQQARKELAQIESNLLSEKQKTTLRNQERQRLQDQAAQLTRQIARLESEAASQVPETEIVAYDSLTGTARKPILIECLQSELRFAAEGVVLSADDLSGFPAQYNPLLAGAEALVKHWEQQSGKEQKPYILLVVRPEGVTGFYIARNLLSSLDHEFGYELIDDKTDLRWPQTQPAAIQALQEAVFSVLNERDQLAQKIGRRSLGTGKLTYADQQGNFHIPEFNDLQRGETGNFIGDDKWVSPHRKRQNYVERKSIVEQKNQRSTNAHRSTQEDVPQHIFDLENLSRPNAMPQQDASSQANRYKLSPAPQTLPNTNAKPIESQEPLPNLPENPFHAKQPSNANSSSTSRPIPSPLLPNKGIGIERELEVHLWADRFQIDDGPTLSIPANTSFEELQQAIGVVISKSITGWDPAPKAYFWKPVAKIVIHPGGIVNYPQVNDLTEKWNVKSNVEYEFQ